MDDANLDLWGIYNIMIVCLVMADKRIMLTLIHLFKITFICGVEVKFYFSAFWKK